MLTHRTLVLTTLTALALAACGPVGGPAGQGPDARQQAGESRTLVISVRVEPGSIASKPLQQGGVTLETSRRLFNASLAHQDNRGAWQLYLAEALPQINTDAWQVFPDGRMQTTYRLKPNLVWHDGTPLHAEDFVFSWRVYATPDLGQSRSPPYSAVEQVLAPDERTIVVRWARPFPDAGNLGEGTGTEFPPLPRHILDGPFQEAQWEAFANHPYWTREFVGLGPYRLDRWEPGAFIEGTIFDAHTLGRPKIPRVRLIFIPDANTTLANVLAGDIHFASDDSIRFQQSLILKQEWGPRQAGQVLSKPNLWRAVYAQFRRELATPAAVTELRVRKAMAHAVDREALNYGMYEGEAILADTIIAPTVPYYAEIDRVLTKYPFDLRRSEQLMNEVGFFKGADGMYARAGEGRFSPEVKTNAATQQEQELAILASGWRQAGFDVQEAILPAAQAQDSQVRASFPAFFAFSSPQGESPLARLNGAAIPRPENRWTGSIRGAWTNPEFDRASELFDFTLDRTERIRHLVQMAKLLSEDLPAISLYFNAIPIAVVAALKGPQPTVPDASWTWNIHEWELR